MPAGRWTRKLHPAAAFLCLLLSSGCDGSGGETIADVEEHLRRALASPTPGCESVPLGRSLPRLFEKDVEWAHNGQGTLYAMGELNRQSLEGIHFPDFAGGPPAPGAHPRAEVPLKPTADGRYVPAGSIIIFVSDRQTYVPMLPPELLCPEKKPPDLVLPKRADP